MIYYQEKELPDSRFDWIVKIYTENKDHQDMVLVACLITVIVICLLFVIPMMRLIHVQLGNFVNGKTTNERYSRALQNQVLGSDGELHTPHDNESLNDELYTENQDLIDHDRLYLMREKGMKMTRSAATPDGGLPIGMSGETAQKYNSTRISMRLRNRKPSGISLAYNNCLQMCCNKKAGMRGDRPTQKQIYEEHIKKVQQEDEWNQKKKSVSDL